MTPELLTAFVAFAFVTSITPGPNNLMLMASGANYGMRRSLSHMLGVVFGFVLLIVLVGFGVVEVLDAWPESRLILGAFCTVYMLWLAWKLARAAEPGMAGATARPMTFFEAAMFQWVNPKSWAMALTAVTAYAPSSTFWSVALVAAVFGAINLPSVASWVILGERMARILTSTRRRMIFNRTMALLLVLSLYPMLTRL